MKVLVSGASGFVGKRVLKLLLENGHEVYGLSRSPEKNETKFPEVKWLKWDCSMGAPELGTLESLDAVINLMGENVATKRWNNAIKKDLYNSRVDGTALLHQGIKNANLEPNVFVSTSAIGVYGDKGLEPVDESAPVASDFLANLCKAWEEAALKEKELYQRSVIIRVGIALGSDGGLAQKLMPLFKLGLGGKLGDGNFYMSWIHVKDLARIFVKAVEDQKMSGIYNASAPFPVTNSEFTKTFANTYRKPAMFNVPKFALKIVMGEMAEYAVKGVKAMPKKLKEDNFHFLYPTIETAVKDVVSVKNVVSNP